MDKNAEGNPNEQGEDQHGAHDVVCEELPCGQSQSERLTQGLRLPGNAESIIAVTMPQRVSVHLGDLPLPLTTGRLPETARDRAVHTGSRSHRERSPWTEGWDNAHEDSALLSGCL